MRLRPTSFVPRFDASRNEIDMFQSKHGPLTVFSPELLLYPLRDAVGAEHFYGVRVSALTMRHTFAIGYLTGGGELYRLSWLLGHKLVMTTERGWVMLHGQPQVRRCG
jgi:site-specific recombinase XerD